MGQRSQADFELTPACIRSARESWGLTQAALAPLLGLSHSSRLSAIENGADPISKQVQLLMQAYIDGYRPADWPRPTSPGD